MQECTFLYVKKNAREMENEKLRALALQKPLPATPPPATATAQEESAPVGAGDASVAEHISQSGSKALEEVPRQQVQNQLLEKPSKSKSLRSKHDFTPSYLFLEAIK